jgi:hypothetical protein
MTYMEDLQQKTKDELVNELYNKRVNALADYEEHEEKAIDKHGHGKRIPYIGWYWRNTDFVNKSISIGDCGEFVGIMERNKWGYPSRKISEQEVDTFIAYLEHAFEVRMDIEKIFNELWDWFQALRDTGYWQ